MNQPLLETLKQARDALEDYDCLSNFSGNKAERVLPSIRAAIEQLEKAEPVMKVFVEVDGHVDGTVWELNGGMGPGWNKLYTHPSTPQWLPIETAPLDGTNILVCEGKEVSIVFYGHDWKGRGDWCCGGDAEEPEIYVAGFNPTHWMPIPAAPSDKE